MRHLFRNSSTKTLGLVFMCLVLAATPFFRLVADEEEVPQSIQYFDDELTATYGKFLQTELSLLKDPGMPVTWEVSWYSLPAGLFLEETNASRVQLFGTAKFTGKWCFILSAKYGEVETRVDQEICLRGQNSSDTPYPYFVTDRYLPNATVGMPYKAFITLDSNSAQGFVGELYDGTIPLNFTVEADKDFSRFIFAGTPEEAGEYVFVLKATDKNGIENYRQYQLTVDLPAPPPPTCPSGYYYDETLGYCVADAPQSCPAGSYYDSVSKTCIQFPAPPPTVYCPAGSHFDHFLGRCVANEAPQCPSNYKWDSYYDRCVRQPYSCPVGTKYSYETLECEQIYYSCDSGMYYDPNRGQCVYIPLSCPRGSVFNSNTGECEIRTVSCPSGSYYDPNRGTCVPNRPNCQFGYRYDYNQNRCVPVDHQRRCPIGSRWSRRDQMCVPVVIIPPPPHHPDPRPMPPPGPGPRPMPMPPHGPVNPLPMPPMPPPGPVTPPGPGPVIPVPPMPPMPPMPPPGPVTPPG
ncbi:MAG: hypothetical protein NT027_17540, partial [Proteobacteria bacterium]|nr:hypothetical protein [Pseudomonadota bacterium]